MSVRLLVLLATFVAISSGLPAVYNTSAISKTGNHFFYPVHNLGSSPYLPLVKYNDVLYYYGAILGGSVNQVDLFCNYHNMKLVSIQTYEESQNLIAGLLSFLETSENVVFWTSGKKVGSNNWRWESTGRPVHYTNWAKGEPNNSGGQENCIEVRFNSTAKTLEWNDDKCDSTNYFICESRDP
nr:unnamed protein product [Callosobruchus chinensis]